MLFFKDFGKNIILLFKYFLIIFLEYSHIIAKIKHKCSYEIMVNMKRMYVFNKSTNKKFKRYENSLLIFQGFPLSAFSRISRIFKKKQLIFKVFKVE